MENINFNDKKIRELTKAHPLLNEIILTKEVFWPNPKYNSFQEAMKKISIGDKDVEAAEERLKRFAPYIAKCFPETAKANGIIESPIVRIPNIHKRLEEIFDNKILGSLLLKCDSHLPISGSIKARGGIYEVLKHAEELAIKNNMLSIEDDYSILDSNIFRSFYSNYSIAVGSTGNLGLSIGIIGAQLGFKVYVHMSGDAKEWKKNLLRSKGVTVIEYDSDYSRAVEEGRSQAQSDPKMYFIDDENSLDLFLGYAVVASRLKIQLKEMDIIVDEDHPLFVYLPCGVGGGPGGVAFGLKLLFGDNVHCFFAEPTHSPCMLIGLMTGLHDKICVQDFGIDNITAADGLAVGRPSAFIGKTLESLISGCFTVEDDNLYKLLSTLADREDIYLEPSALAGIPGAVKLFKDKLGRKYIKDNNLEDKMKNAVHIPWATGGSMVPRDVIEEYYNRGLRLNK